MPFLNSIIPQLIDELHSGKSQVGGIIPDILKSEVMDAVRQCINNYKMKAAEGTRFDSSFKSCGENEDDRDLTEIITSRIFYVRNSSVKIITGNILSSKCDVIVSSDDDLITQGGGVSEAISREGGKVIHYDARKNIPAKLGDVVVTSAGKLVQKYIFHAVTLTRVKNQKNVHLTPKEESDIQKFIISNSIQRSFNLLSALELSSAAFPVIGTGAAQIPFREAITWMLENFAVQLQKTARSLHIELWVYHNHHGVDIASIAEGILTQQEPQQIPIPQSGTSEEYDVFVSYSRKDSKKTEELISFLRSRNLRIWRDTDKIMSGDNYKRDVVRAIRHSKSFIFISSVNSNQSENVVKEISIAVERHIPIIPIRIDSSPYADEIAYDITNIDFLSLNKENSFERVYIAVASKLKLDCASVIFR